MSPDTCDPDRPAPPGAAPGPPPTPDTPAPAAADAAPPATDDAAPPAPARCWQPPAPAGWSPPPDAPRRPGRAAALALGAAAVLTVLGAPLGLLWAAVAPDTPVIKSAEGAVYAQPQPEQPIAADGWFSLLGLGFGVLAALGLWLLLPRRRGPLGLVAGALGGLGAALVAWQLGRRGGLSAYEHLLTTAADGQAFDKPADLRAGGFEWLLGVLPVPYGNLLLPAFGAAVTYTLLAGWSRWPSLRPEPEPDVAATSGPGAADGPAVSSAPVDPPAPTVAPEPPAPGAAEPPRD